MKRRDMRSTIILALAIPLSILALILASTLTFGLLFSFTGNSLYQNLLLLVDFALLFVLIVATTIEYRRLYAVYHAGLYETSRHNLQALGNGNSDLEMYPKEYQIEEFDELNRAIEGVKKRYDVSVIYSPAVDYDEYGVEWVDKDRHLVDIKYLLSHLEGLVDLSKAFTVGLLSLHYDLKFDKLTPEERDNLLRLANEAFSFVPGRLMVFNNDNKGILCYLPGIDSLRIVREKIVAMREECSIARRQAGGMTFQSLQAAMVCYPYSSVEDMVPDLSYAKRQHDPITIFLPDRKKEFKGGGSMFKNTDTVAFFNKVLLPLRHLPPVDSDKNRKTLQTVFESVCSFLGSDFHDVVLWNPNTRSYYSYFYGHEVSDVLIRAMMDIVDEDNSFFFSSRQSCSQTIARFVDDYGVESGLIYALFDGKETLGAMYIGRTKGTMLLDSYMKEAIIRMGEAFSDYFFLCEKEKRANSFQSETEHLLGITDYMLYKIDDANFRLSYFSPNLKKVFPDAEIGELCHKALYGYDKMCPDCPLREKKKRVEKRVVSGKSKKEQTFITSMTLNAAKSHERSFLVQRVNEANRLDPYDNDWLCYSFPLLVDALRNAYYINSRGYLLLLNIDNLTDQLASQGSEGSCFLTRAFINEVKQALQTNEVYVYTSCSMGILLPRYGHVEVIDVCEKIYEISKRIIVEGSDKNATFNLTYMPLGYPHGHASADDFLAHVEDYYHFGDHPAQRDFIYFDDHSICRSASKKLHMLSVIDEVFGSKAASCMSLQPMVLAADKRLVGAEILLRVEDTIRRNFFRADELSRLAVENDRISLITESILNFVGQLYQEHGKSIFALNNFRRISINVDDTFLKDEGLSAKVKSLSAEQHMEKDFLSFEVPEDLVNRALESGESGFLGGTNSYLVCDRYTGQFVSMEKLKNYGFREVKLPRELILGIDVDAKKLASIESLVRHAQELGLKVSVVGVENEAQYLALKELDPTMLIQGYYFYKPLSRSDLITAIMAHGK